MLPTHKTILPKKFAPKHTMSQGNAPHPPKGKLIYPHTINILHLSFHLSFHHSRHFLSSIQHAHTSLKSSKSNTYKTKRPLYSTWLYKGLFLRYLLYFILYLALSFCLYNKTESRHATHLTDYASLVAKPSVMPSNSHKAEKAPHSKQACQWHFFCFMTALSPFPIQTRKVWFDSGCFTMVIYTVLY